MASTNFIDKSTVITAEWLNDVNSAVYELADSIADLRLISGSATRAAIALKGYYSDGDGGGGQFYWDAVNTTTDNGGTIIQPTGITTGRWIRLYSGAVNVKWFGAKGDGTTDDTARIQAAITIGNAYFPTGTYIVNDIDSDSIALSLSSLSGRLLYGDGIGESIIKLADSQDSHVISLASCSDIVIRDLEINGNKSNQTAGHGIRLDSCTNVSLLDLKVVDARHYGIGAQAGTLKQIFFDRIIIKDSGGDGIDFKNKDDDNSEIFFNKITIDNPGTVTATQAGIDMRGPCVASNIHIINLTEGHFGIRFREGALLSASGLGSHYSSLSNFYVQGDNSGAISVGVYVGASYVAVGNGTILETGIGFQDIAGADHGKYSNIHTLNCITRGHWIGSDNSTLSLPDSDNCEEGIRIDGQYIKVIGGDFSNNTTRDIALTASSSNALFESNYIGGSVLDSGTSNSIKDNLGYITEASGTGSVTSGGTTDVITHGLNTTPSIENILIMGTENPTNDIGNIWVDTITAAQFTVNVRNDPGASNWDFGWSVT